MPSSKIGQLPSDIDASLTLTEFMSNQVETITMETEAPALYKAMSEASKKSGGNDFKVCVTLQIL